MRVRFLEISLVAAAGLILGSGASVAQQNGRPAMAQIPVEEVVVVAPYMVRERAVEQRQGQLPVLSTTVQTPVSYAGLDLNRQADVSEFEKRIRDAAREGCVQLERMYRDYIAITSRMECTRMAIRDGLGKMEDVIAASTAG